MNTSQLIGAAILAPRENRKQAEDCALYLCAIHSAVCTAITCQSSPDCGRILDSERAVYVERKRDEKPCGVMCVQCFDKHADKWSALETRGFAFYDARELRRIARALGMLI